MTADPPPRPTDRAGTGRARRSIATLLATTVLTGIVVASDARLGGSATPPAELVSVVTEVGFSYHPSITDDGASIAFTTGESIPDESDHERGRVRDRVGSRTVPVPNVFTNDDHQQELVISRDDCHLAYIAEVLTTIPGGSVPFFTDMIMVADRCAGTPPVQIWPRTSQEQSQFGFEHLAISAHGRYVAFRGYSTLTVTRLDRDADGNGVLGDTPLGVATTPGRASTPVLGDETLTGKVAIEVSPSSSTDQIVLWDPTLPAGDPAAMTLVSAIDGTTAPFAGSRAFEPSMTPDGRFVAFAMLNGGTDGGPAFISSSVQILVRDVATNRTRLISRNSAGLPANNASFNPSITIDGTQVAFGTTSTDLLAPGFGGTTPDGPGSLDLLVVRSTAGFFDSVGFDRVSLKPNGESINANDGSQRMDHPVISGNGRWVAFESTFGVELGDPGQNTSPSLPVVQQVYVIARPPAVTVSPLEFGNVKVGETSPVLAATVANSGISSVRPATIAAAGPFTIVPGGTCTIAAWLSPGQSCTVNIRFGPGAAGPATAALTVAEEGFAALTVTGALTGAGTTDPPPTTTTTTSTTTATTTATTVPATTTTTPVPPSTTTSTTARPPTTTTTARVPATVALTITPDPAEFAAAPLGAAATPLTLTVTSSGNAPAPVGAIAIGGPDAADFSLVADGCTGVTLAPQTGCTITIGFTPTAVGLRVASITAGAPVAPVTSTITGRGLDHPELRLLPDVFVPGDVTTAAGLAFPPNTTVELQWTGEPGRFTATTDATGRFVVDIGAPTDGIPGPHTLVAVDQPGLFTGVSALGLLGEANARPPTNQNPAVGGFPGLIDRG